MKKVRLGSHEMGGDCQYKISNGIENRKILLNISSCRFLPKRVT